MYREKKIFKSYISLGWYCGTAASMEKHGLRSFAYPFDWVSSLDFGGVFYQMETNFAEFLEYDNLEQTSITTFRDMKYNLIFPHDIELSLKKEYSKIYEKYQRRIQRFRDSIEEPVCFIRSVTGDKEAEYIQNNYENIIKIIKGYNCENEIIFLLLAGTRKITNVPGCYVLDINEWRDDEKIRDVFDSGKDFLEYCKAHIEESAYTENLQFAKRKYTKEEEFRKESELLKQKILKIKNNDCNSRKVIVEKFPKIEEGVYIFGAGYYGKEIAEIFRKNNISVRAFIDNNPQKWDTFQEGIQVLNPNNLKNVQGYVIIAMLRNENTIAAQLKNYENPGLKCISMKKMICDIVTF